MSQNPCILLSFAQIFNVYKGDESMNSNLGNIEKAEQQRIYLEGLKKYNERGIPIYIDGEECGPEDYYRIFEVKEEGAFYMGDYVGADLGKLTEIRFDKVYYQ